MTQSPYRLRALTGEDEYKAGEVLMERGGVRLVEQSDAQIVYHVAGGPRYQVTLRADSPARCQCGEWQEKGACRHVVAATLMAQQSGALDEMLRRKAVAAAPKLMSAMESALPEDGNLNMEVTLFYDSATSKARPQLKLGLRVGEERL